MTSFRTHLHSHTHAATPTPAQLVVRAESNATFSPTTTTTTGCGKLVDRVLFVFVLVFERFFSSYNFSCHSPWQQRRAVVRRRFIGASSHRRNAFLITHRMRKTARHQTNCHHFATTPPPWCLQQQ